MELKGEWEFYWEKFILTDKINILQPDLVVAFPSIWTKYDFNKKKLPSYGYASYKLKIKTDKEYNNLSLEIPDFYTSYRLWIDGKIISDNGRIGKNKNEYKPFWQPFTKKINNIKNNTEIVIEISNFIHIKAGSVKAILLGKDNELTRKREIQISQTFLLTGILLMGGVFFLGLFLFGKREKYILYFSLFCFIYSYRVFGTGIYIMHSFFKNLYFLENLALFTLRLEYLALYLSVLLFILFTEQLYPKETSNYFVKLNIFITIFSCSLVIFFPPIIYTQTIEPFFIILFMNIAYIFIIFLKATFNKEKGAIISLIGAFSFFSIAIINILNYLVILPKYDFLSFIGYIHFFLVQSLVLSYRFAESFKLAETEAKAGIKVKSDFMATMSHEIRTPMNGVIGMTDLLLRTRLNDEQKDFVETIKISGNNLLQIINEILDFSKIESGKIQIENSNTDLLKSIEEVISLFNYNAVQKNIELSYYIEENVPRFIYTDYLKLKQIISNLINNAIKFTEKGEIILYVKKINNIQNIYQLEFSVSDTGIGIPEDKKENIFKPFTQLDSSISRKYAGTGLGLVISKNITEKLGGNMSFESILNEGTTFTFTINTLVYNFESVYEKVFHGLKIKTFVSNNKTHKILDRTLSNIGVSVISDNENIKPDIIISSSDNYNELVENNVPIILIHNDVSGEIENKNSDNIKHIIKPIFIEKLKDSILELTNNKKEIKQIVEHNNEKNNFRDLKILIAEDNKVNQKVVQKMLNSLGFNPDIVENGLEALNITKEKNYDLIFMDMQMPEMSGLQATEKIRLDNNFKNIIVALTANAMDEDKEKCLKAGMNDYISKPIKIDELLSIIKKYF